MLGILIIVFFLKIIEKMSIKCLNPFNEYYVKEFNQMAIDARNKGSKNLMATYKKVVFSLSKYPFPIVTSSQATSLEGIGETICKTFDNLISCYKDKIEKEGINYISLAYNIDLNYANKIGKSKTKKGIKKKAESQSQSKKMLGSKTGVKKYLVDIKLFSSTWTSVICSYVLYIQKEKYEIIIDDVFAMSSTLIDLLKLVDINIQESVESDFPEMKNLGLLDKIDSKKIKINEYLVKLANLELKKIGVTISKDDNGEINFSLYEKEEYQNKVLASQVSQIKENPNTEPYDSNNETNDGNILQKFSDFISDKSQPNSNVILCVDMREKGGNNENFKIEILNTISDRTKIKIDERNLALGDFLWVYHDDEKNVEYVIDYIIERKTLNDLAYSIIDGRYVEQKFRLKNSFFQNTFYLFEGTTLSLHSKTNINKSAINTAINNTINIHDINIIKTDSTRDTVNLLIEIDRNIRENFSFLHDLNGNKVTFDEYIKMNQKTKNSTTESIFLRQLRSFDSIGAKSVEIISRCFKTPLYLFKIIQACKREGVSQEDLNNLISVASYLEEEEKEVNEKNILYYLKKKENFSKIKKKLKSVKKIRKDAVEKIINFYLGDEDEEETEEEKENPKDLMQIDEEDE